MACVKAQLLTKNKATTTKPKGGVYGGGETYTLDKEYNNIHKVLNRLLSMDVEIQQAIFEYFHRHVQVVAQQARLSGEFDQGVLGELLAGWLANLFLRFIWFVRSRAIVYLPQNKSLTEISPNANAEYTDCFNYSIDKTLNGPKVSLNKVKIDRGFSWADARKLLDMSEEKAFNGFYLEKVKK